MDRQRILEIQTALQSEGLDGWLFYDFRGSDPLAYRILGLDLSDLSTRRWYYLIPAKGEPSGIVSTVEPHRLDALPGRKLFFLSWQEHQQQLRASLGSSRRIAMQYSPENAIPDVCRVDAGTVEFIRRLGVEVVSSADLVQRFEAVWTPSQWEAHLRAAKGVRETLEETFAYVRRRIIEQGGGRTEALSEYEAQQFILRQFVARGLTTNHPPIVAVNAHSANPHYCATQGQSTPILLGDFLLIDLWAKECSPDAVYADITWTGFLGEEVPSRYQEIFSIVRRARDSAIALVDERVRKGQSIYGYEVDGVARRVIEESGYGRCFLHRTGHSIGEEVHGNGVNMDGLETRDERRVLPHTCFSIEPGIYLQSEFGIRSEVNVYVTQTESIVTGGPRQTEVIPILR